MNVESVEKVGRTYRLDDDCPECGGPLFAALVRTTDGAPDIAWHCDACLAHGPMTERGH